MSVWCDIRLRLVVVVVRDEVLNGVVRQHLSQFVRRWAANALLGHHQGAPLRSISHAVVADFQAGGRATPVTLPALIRRSSR